MKRALLLSISLLLATFPYESQAIGNLPVPTEAEWLGWPDYCRARFVVSGSGRDTQYVARIGKGQIRQQEIQIGAEAWYWLHHYCAALIYFERAKEADIDRVYRHQLRRARTNFLGQFQHISVENPFFPNVAINLGRLFHEMGEPEQALKYLKLGMDAHSSLPGCYAVAAIVYRDLGQLDNAIDTLITGIESVEQDSAELHYFLGLIYVDVGNIDAAVLHAKEAYRLGYPLPGLQAKISRLGRSLN